MPSRWGRRGTVTLLLALCWVGPAGAQAGPATSAEEVEALRRELRELRQGQAAILKELQDLRTLLLGAARRGPAAMPPEGAIGVAGARFRGNARAPVTVVEFTDFQCPFCARYVRDTFPQIEREYIRTGKVRYVVRDFPIVGLHPQAFKGHEAARCAGDQGKLWEMHRRLFEAQNAMGPSELEAHAQALGLDLGKFRQCLEGEAHAAAVRRDLEDGSKAGVSGTPTFLIGRTEPGEPTIKVSRVMSGAQPYARFKEAIDALLPPSGQPAPPRQ